MNIVFLSPHFPENFYLFCKALKSNNVNVLGIGENIYDNLKKELKDSLTEYYKVNSMENYEEILKACGFFTHKYGKLDRFESLNEHWLFIEAKIRSDFNISGIKDKEVDFIKRKSLMKKKFIDANIPAPIGSIVNDFFEAEEFIGRVGYPIIAKPDIGVGATDTYKISNKEELLSFFKNKKSVDYFFEEFIDGIICSYDGLTDKDGEIVFSGSLEYGMSVMDSVNKGIDVSYNTLRDIPEKLEKYGKKAVKAFDLKERFFHIEFFRTEKNEFIALEANIRPPGGYSIDMHNFANNIDLYKLWADILTGKKIRIKNPGPFYCCYIGRKHNDYTHSKNDIINQYKKEKILNSEMSEIFRKAMGNYAYIFKTAEKEKMKEIMNFVLARKK